MYTKNPFFKIARDISRAIKPHLTRRCATLGAQYYSIWEATGFGYKRVMMKNNERRLPDLNQQIHNKSNSNQASITSISLTHTHTPHFTPCSQLPFKTISPPPNTYKHAHTHRQLCLPLLLLFLGSRTCGRTTRPAEVSRYRSRLKEVCQGGKRETHVVSHGTT